MRQSPTADEGQSSDWDPGSLAVEICHRGKMINFQIREASWVGRIECLASGHWASRADIQEMN